MRRKVIFVPAMAMMFAAFACGSGRQPGTTRSEGDGEATEMSGIVFDEDSAFRYLQTQCGFGPRVPGSRAHAECGGWLESELSRHGAEVSTQRATIKAPDGSPLRIRNIIGQYNPDAADRLLLLAHWDTRPTADEDPDAAKRDTPVPGANDGASGVAVLLEIARHLAGTDPGRGVDILFADAEDMGNTGDDESWALGARYFATHPFREGYVPTEVILLDMVGDRGAVFTREYFSMQSAPNLVDRLWTLGRRLGYGKYFSDMAGGAVTDDHVEFIKQGIPAVDIIGSDPRGGFSRWWHTTGDTPDKIDPATLKAVGQTVTEYIYRRH